MSTRIFAHRGASADFPENTMAAFREAIRQGAEGIELDVHMTRDGRVVVMHDETLRRTTGEEGRIIDHTYDQLRRFNAKYHFDNVEFEPIPLLEEVLELVADTRLELNIELKNTFIQYEGIEETVARLVRNYAMEGRVVISSFNHYSLVAMHRVAPELKTAILYTAALVDPWEYAKRIGSHGLHPHFLSVRPFIVEGAHKAGIAVRPYTVDHPDEMRRLIQCGCDAIITNKPALLKRVREELAG